MKSLSAPPYAQNQKGFTLVELLVATVLLSLVMSSVYSLTHSSLRTWRGVEGGVEMHFDARSFFTLFSHEYNCIVGRAEHLFEGDNKSITMFVIAQPLDLDEGEGSRLMRVIYSWNRNKRSIEREEALVTSALPKRLPEKESLDRSKIKVKRRYKTTVAENVSRFEITYIWVPLPAEMTRDTPPEPEPPIYKKESRERWGLPQGIRLEVEMKDPDIKGKNYNFDTIMPMRAQSFRQKREQLEEMLSGK
ncbi:MAG: prepilin-type N-terminal cleavage/methylation domain-containing protein [Candidatus Hydrogenedens sp.]|nr:prepilin-type N-terminal cleavage/methylation domain-containing protein [Candidatus Hydrogenedens sp.]